MRISRRFCTSSRKAESWPGNGNLDFDLVPYRTYTFVRKKVDRWALGAKRNGSKTHFCEINTNDYKRIDRKRI